MNAAVRPLRTDDFDRVQEIERDAGRLFLPLGMPEIAYDEPPSVDTLASYVTAGRAWVIDPPSDVAGYVLVDVVDGAAHVEQITVATKYARRRLGAMLLEHVERWARDRGLREITLTSFRDVPWNGPYYETLGFRAVAEEATGPEMAELLVHEREHGLWKWPRLIMIKRLAQADQT